jgi:DNA-binding beta-propeller fold protein YncE
MTLRSLLLAAALLLLLPGVALAGNTAWISSNHIQVVDLDTARVTGRIPLSEFIHDMEFSPDGSSVYVGSSKGFRVADADRLEFTQKVDARPTSGISVSADGSRLVAIHKADHDAAQAARLAGLPLPASTLIVYSTLGMSIEQSFPISAQALDAVISPDGATIYVLVPQEGAVHLHGLDGTLIESIELADVSGSHDVMLSRLALSPDGSRLVVPCTDATQSWLADVDLAGTREGRVLRQELGHARRIQGLSWDQDGTGVYVSAVKSVVKFNELGLPVEWKQFPVNYVDVKAIPGSDSTVMVTPTFSNERGTGGLSVIGADGAVVRTLELADISPFIVIVRP